MITWFHQISGLKLCRPLLLLCLVDFAGFRKRRDRETCCYIFSCKTHLFEKGVAPIGGRRSHAGMQDQAEYTADVFLKQLQATDASHWCGGSINVKLCKTKSHLRVQLAGFRGSSAAPILGGLAYQNKFVIWSDHEIGCPIIGGV